MGLRAWEGRETGGKEVLGVDGQAAAKGEPSETGAAHRRARRSRSSRLRRKPRRTVTSTRQTSLSLSHKASRQLWRRHSHGEPRPPPSCLLHSPLVTTWLPPHDSRQLLRLQPSRLHVRQQGGRSRRSRARLLGGHFPLHATSLSTLTGRNSVLGLHRAAREAGRCHLDSGERGAQE